MKRHFLPMLEGRWAHGHHICVGLDSDPQKIPESIQSDNTDTDSQVKFNSDIVEATHDIVCAYKINVAFYAGHMLGTIAIQNTISHIHSVAPEVPVILDGKFGDIGNTNRGYISYAFELLDADAVTVQPYLGGDSLLPFLNYDNKGVLVLCRTSNPGAGELQDRIVSITDEEANRWDLERGTTMPLYQLVARRVSREWNILNNCGLVVGATYPKEISEVRRIVDDMPLLIPGIGAQGGDLKASVMAARDGNKCHVMINSSRSTIFASPYPDYADAARRDVQQRNKEVAEALTE